MSFNLNLHMYNTLYQPLIFTGNFTYANMIERQVMGDGSCFFHAIVEAFYAPYKAGYEIIDGVKVPFNRAKFVRELRDDLANKLNTPVIAKHQKYYDDHWFYDESGQATNITYYDILANGTLGQYANESKLNQYSLSGMQDILRSNMPVDLVYQEYISLMLEIDIYVLDLTTNDVANMNRDLTQYNGRNSVVIIYNHATRHYNLVGLKLQGSIKTFFTADHPFITAIRDRISLR